MRLFSLIEREDVHPAPDTKVLPAAEFSKLLEAEEIVDKAQKEAVVYKEKVEQECEVLKEEAKKAGFEEGLQQFNAHIAKIEQERKEERKEIENSLTPLALTAVRKIIGAELKTNPKAIVDIVSTALKTVTQHRRVAIYVCRSDLDFVEAERPRIKALFEHVESLTIAARDDVEGGGCIIETEAGIINAQLDSLLKALESAFHTFFKQKRKKDESD